MLSLLYILPVMIVAPLFALSHSHKHYLMCLLNLEALTLTIIIVTFTLLFKSSYLETLNSLVILSFGACEASIGLACLVKMMRIHGSDNTKTLNIKCL